MNALTSIISNAKHIKIVASIARNLEQNIDATIADICFCDTSANYRVDI